MNATYQLAQLNVAQMKGPLESPVMQEFVDNLVPINSLAESSPGFVWRLQDEDGDATGIRPFGDDLLVNLSVWSDIASLRGFVFDSLHKTFLVRRNEWFDRMDGVSTVLWWVPFGHIPSVEEAADKLAQQRDQSATQDAFGFRQPFPPPS